MEECEQGQGPSKVHDVEEGEISDSASSVEEITEEVFNKQEPSPAALSSPADLPPPPPKATNVNSEISNNSSNHHNINNNNSNNNNQKPRVWTMRDLYKYQISRNYTAGLYNLAWASAVQNKPLDEVLVMDYPKTTSDSDAPTNLKRVEPEGSLSSKCNINNNGNVVVGGGESKDAFAVGAKEKVVIEVDDEGKPGGGEEKEEGELEEGEIDVDSEVVDEIGNFSKEGELISLVGENSVLEKRVDSILKGLENVTVQEAEKSFGEVCSRVQILFDNLQDMDEENSLTKKDDLAKLLFTVIQTVNTVFCSMNQNQQEQMRESIKRLLSDITSQKRSLFSAEQLKEMGFMISSLDSFTVASRFKVSDCNKEMQAVQGFAENDTGISFENVNQDLVKNYGIDSIHVKPSDQTNSRMSLENLKFGAANSKYRGLSLPFLDLHKDHDADSLPSPTREAPSCLPIDKGFGMGHGVLKPEWPIPRVVLETDNVLVHPYETDAVKAVSTYQQKFGQSSFLMNDRLPSPTPSEDGNTGDGDMNEEVSSSPNRPVIPVNTTLVGQYTVSSATKMENITEQGRNSVQNASWLSSGPNPQLRPSSAKSRDPRLRLANSDAATWDRLLANEPKVEPVGGMISSRKQKTVEEPDLDGPALKRQRNELTDSGIVNDAQAVSGTGGWLEDTGNVGLLVTARKPEVGNDPKKPAEAVTGINSSSIMPNITVKVNENLPVATPSAPASLQSLLKDLAVNPSILMGIIKMGQLNSTDPTKSTTQPSSLNAMPGPVPLTNLATPKTSFVGRESAGILQTSLETASMEEPGTIRMKPRDPRRFLHSNTLQKGGSMELDQSQTKTSTLSTSGLIGNLNGQTPDNQIDKKSMPSSISPPDITRQFTKNLKNIADLLSVSQAISSTSVPPQVPSSQPAQAVQGWIDSKGISELGCSQSGTYMAGKELSTGTADPQNNWVDVEHLFEGFDDQQKAAIQRERARRIEEQRKMFAAQKLCLVLDLDHTLLNSAKFTEVDPVHDEVLRKKEEQDREKPHRHLFRFPHMGMWTKLRPGIWNFLEKASKLFELHLYTMGNKLYATEMAKLLDPKGNLFAGRVISRGDDGDLLDGDERVPKSKDLEGVLGMESSVVIIDDSVRVWPHNKLNLIVVERYIYFPCSRRQFGLPGPSLLEIDHDERPEDGTLASSLAVVERIHQIFFAHQSLDEADVRNILASEQRKILAGCRIVFSRVFPVGEANPHLHPLWQTAEQFGAVCINSIDEQVTHVVANSLGTDKVNWAMSTGRFVVHPGWVEASALLYRRANEHDFAVKP